MSTRRAEQIAERNGNMSQPRVSLWAADDIDDDLQVDVNLAIGNYGQNGLYEDGACSRSIFVWLIVT